MSMDFGSLASSATPIAVGGIAGFLVGYAFYLVVHYVVHVYQPPKNFMKVLWVNHAVHHYKHGEYIFGVSSPLWDYIYGTMKEKEGKAYTHHHHDHHH